MIKKFIIELDIDKNIEDVYTEKVFLALEGNGIKVKSIIRVR